LQTPLRRAGSARLASFHYEILEILDAGAADVCGFSDGLQQTGSWAVIYPTAEGVFTESISEAYYSLLKELDGSTPPANAAKRLGISTAEAVKFLEFALAEGIIER
jgi:hypothetical protein